MAQTNGLSGMLLADLKRIASGLGIKGSSTMKKAQLVDAIGAHQSGQGGGAARTAPRDADRAPEAVVTSTPPTEKPVDKPAEKPADKPAEKAADQTVERPAPEVQVTRRTRSRGNVARPDADESSTRQADPTEAKEEARQDQAKQDQAKQDQARQEQGQDRPKKDRSKKQSGKDQGKDRQGKQDQGKQDKPKQDQPKQDQPKQDQGKQDQGRQDQSRPDQSKQDQGKQDQGRQDPSKQDQQAGQGQQNQQGQNQQAQNQQAQNQQAQLDEEEGGGRRNRRRRARDRNRQQGVRGESEPQVYDDDVLVPAAGILDVLDNYAFVRTSGYLAGPDDVYLSLSLVRKHGLRRGDAVVGQVRQPRDGERREKFNPMVRIDSINGADPDAALQRPDFDKLTPLFPDERLRLETDATNLIGRVIDIAAPIGKGQRGLIVSPARAGKTMVLQQIARSVSANNPECHLMVVLVDERPEEVTDFERSVKGEVIASTFDRPASDHTMVAELAIERAKRLVELGHDVVVLLDGITRLGRAYNLAAAPSGRVLSGGVDASAIHPPKRFFGAARNIEDGGSLTILATALVESGSAVDEVIFEEFEGTGNLEIRLCRELAERQLFPAIDPVRSGTRREERLLGEEEQAIVRKLRRLLAELEPAQAHDLMAARLHNSQNNLDFLRRIQQSTPADILRAR